MGKKVLCFLEKWESGGIEAFLTNAFESEDFRDTSIDIVVFKKGPSVFDERIKALGIKIIELSGKNRSLKHAEKFEKLIRKNKYDCAHFNIFHGVSLELVQIAKDNKIKTRIVHSHGTGLRKSPLKFLKMGLHHLYKLRFSRAATRRIACSHEAGEFIFGKKSFEIIPNGINAPKYLFSREKREEMRRELYVDDEILVGHIGRLSSEKNQEFLIKAFAEFQKKEPNSKLILIGEGKKERYSAIADKLGVRQSLIFYGASKQIPELLAAMDMFVFPSVNEGLGIAMIEAQASGLPILCSEAIPQIAKITDIVNTMSLEEGELAWAEKMCDILKNQTDLEKRAEYAEKIKNSEFNIDNTARLIREAYNSSN